MLASTATHAAARWSGPVGPALAHAGAIPPESPSLLPSHLLPVALGCAAGCKFVILAPLEMDVRPSLAPLSPSLGARHGSRS
jgi:hypothetical protein